MGGVTVLSTYPGYTSGFILGAVILIGIFGLFFLASAGFLFWGGGLDCIGVGLLSLVFGVLCFVVAFDMRNDINQPTYSKVTISEQVSFNAFTEKYEVIDVDGKIYNVRERGE